jgi:hypothetical protein
VIFIIVICFLSASTAFSTVLSTRPNSGIAPENFKLR